MMTGWQRKVMSGKQMTVMTWTKGEDWLMTSRRRVTETCDDLRTYCGDDLGKGKKGLLMTSRRWMTEICDDG